MLVFRLTRPPIRIAFGLCFFLRLDGRGLVVGPDDEEATFGGDADFAKGTGGVADAEIEGPAGGLDVDVGSGDVEVGNIGFGGDTCLLATALIQRQHATISVHRACNISQRKGMFDGSLSESQYLVIDFSLPFLIFFSSVIRDGVEEADFLLVQSPELVFCRDRPDLHIHE